MSARRPLIHVGYHKTGSTWLQERIFSDPAFGFRKTATPLPVDEAFVALEPFTFDPDRAREVMAGLFADAAAADAVPVISHERLSGDIETGGVDAPLIADRLAATYPDARILVVIREQRDMLLSIHKTELTFGTYRIPERWRDRTITERRSPSPTLSYFAYDRLISRYRELFGADDVLVLPYELLRRDAGAFVSSIASFCGVAAPAGNVPDEAANPALPALLLEANRWANKVVRAFGMGDGAFAGPLEERKAKRGQLKALRKVAPFVPAVLSRPIERRWRRQAETLIGHRFVESNRTVERITGLDLGGLGYMV